MRGGRVLEVERASTVSPALPGIRIHLPSGEVRVGGSRIWVGFAVLEVERASFRFLALPVRFLRPTLPEGG